MLGYLYLTPSLVVNIYVNCNYHALKHAAWLSHFNLDGASATLLREAILVYHDIQLLVESWIMHGLSQHHSGLRCRRSR